MGSQPQILVRPLHGEPFKIPVDKAIVTIGRSKRNDLVLADQCVAKGFLDLAAQCYRAVVRLQPSHLEAWHCLVETHLQFGAEEDLLPDYLAIARIHQSDGLHREAVQWFQRTLALDPENVTAHYNLQLLFAALGDPTRSEFHRRRDGGEGPSSGEG